ncbi:MAG: hypothetical protein RLN89_01400 [Parvibaculum sp.]
MQELRAKPDGKGDSARIRAAHLSSHVLRGVLISLLLGGLAACTDDEKEKQTLNSPQSLSSPYVADPLDAPLYTASIPTLQRTGVFIQLPTGLPTELASLLLARIQEASVASGLPLAKTGTIPEITIKGVARAGIAPTGTAIALVWEVIDAKGNRLRLITDDALVRRPDASPLDRFDPWATVDAKTIEKIADQTAFQIAGWYQADFLSPDESNIATASLAPDQAPNPALGPQQDPRQDPEPDLPQTEQTPINPIDFTTPSLLATAEGGETAIIQEGTGKRDATLAENLTPTPSIATAAAETTSPAPTIIATVTRPGAPPVADPIVTASIATETPSQPNGAAPLAARNYFDVAVGTSPGNGQIALAAAVQEALLDLPTGTNAPSAYRILGNVTLSKAEAGKAHVTIEWTVAAKDGAPLGLVSQSNIVEAEEISGIWGDVATQAGNAAAQGILQLINPTRPKA